MDIAAGLQSFKLVFDTVNALSTMRTDTERALAISKIVGELGQVQGALLASQGRELTLTQEKAALEAEVMRLKDWSAQKQRYELKNHGYEGGQTVFAYAVKESERGTEPPHSLCPDCFANGKPSLLVEERRVGGAQVLFCNACDWTGFKRGFAERGARGRR